jgi:hypothetical protein
VSQKLVISVDASEGGPELVTVQDVLTHVLDLFQLITESDPLNEDKVAWRLVSATMNSPFTVTAEAVPRYPNIAVDRVAASQVESFVSNYSELRQGRIPLAWSGEKPRKTVSRLLARSRFLINHASIKSIDGPPVADVEITPSIAAQVARETTPADLPTVAKIQMGSIEGTLVQVQRYYQQPAIQIIERKTRQAVWCVVPEEFQHEISESTSVEDVWRGSRVLVKGKIHYGSDGKISRVAATSVRRIEPEVVLDDAIVDTDFTGGLSVSEYLEKFRDGKLD